MVNKHVCSFYSFETGTQSDLTLMLQQNERFSDQFAAMLVETTAESIALSINLTYN